MRDLVQSLIDRGYRPVPHFEQLETYSQYADGSTYPADDKRWSSATYPAVALADDMILIDRDNKSDAASIEQIAEALGITVAELNKALVQTDMSGQSFHFVFRMVGNHKIRPSTGEWLPGVDIKVGCANGLINIKPGKIEMLPSAESLQLLDLSRVVKPFPERVELPTSSVPMATTDVTTEAGQRVLERICERLQDVGEGGRNSELNTCALMAGHYVAGGDIAQADAVAALSEAATVIGLTDAEIRATLTSGMRRGMQEPKLAQRTPAEIFRDVPQLVTPTPMPEVVQPTPQFRTGFQIVAGSNLVEHFTGCVYVSDLNKVLTPDGQLLDSQRMNAWYGGYCFSLDDTGDKTTRKAWEAFTESMCVSFPKVHKIDYNPDTPFGQIEESAEGVRSVNNFKPLTCPGEPGDVSIFTNHIKNLFPEDHDQLLDWMAVKAQNPGKCMLWAPVLIGTYGNGKTSVADLMAAVLGEGMCTIVQSGDVENKFNGWVYGNTFAVINDFKVGDKHDVMEILKPIITDRTIPYQKKGLEVDKCRNMLGIMITSNHDNAIIKTRDDRRYAPFISPHKCTEDLIRDGMDYDYFHVLNSALMSEQMIKYMRYFLLNRNVVDFPARAPVTSGTRQAVRASLGGVEQEIMEAIDEGRTGFAGGWVSSFALDELIAKLRAERQIPRSKRHDLMRSLGYDYHPALRDGRVDNPLLSANGRKPRLFVKVDSLMMQLERKADVAKHYEAAQGDPVAIAQVASVDKSVKDS